MPVVNLLIAIYSGYDEAAAFIRKIQDLDFDVGKLSLLGKDYRAESKLVGRYQSRDRTRCWENLNAFGGEIWGLLSGVAFFHIPEMGPFLVGGPLAASIIGALEGAAVVRDLSAIGSGLCITGVPRDRIPKYERAVETGKYLVITQGTEEELAEIKTIIRKTGVAEFDLYQK